MSVRTAAATALLAGASVVMIGTATPALALCDAYSGGCPSAPPAGGGGGTDIGGSDDSPATGTDAPPNTGNGGTDGTDDGTGTGGTGTGSAPGGTDGPELSGTTSNASTLPFTGGELVLMTAAGLGALAGGTALVVAGRRRTATHA